MTKQPTNLSIDKALLRAARERKFKKSVMLEDALREQLRREDHAAWIEENEQAFEECQAVVSQRGVFSDALRRF